MGIGAAKGAAPRKTGMAHPPSRQAQQTRSKPPVDVSVLYQMDLNAQSVRDFRLTTARYLGLAQAGTDEAREVPGAAGSVA